MLANDVTFEIWKTLHYVPTNFSFQNYFHNSIEFSMKKTPQNPKTPTP
jgi:hypothetical protein